MKKKFLQDLNNQSEIDKEYEEKANFLIQKQKLERIDNFNGYYDFLNNEYQCLVYYQGLIFKSVSYAFQAARSTQDHIREKISKATSIQELIDIATGIEDPADWNKVRIKVMETLVRDKFRRNKDLRDKLMATENRSLINTFEDATSSNIFWGIVDGNGQNQLGRILEQVRDDCQKQVELQAWLYTSFNLQEDLSLIPIIKLKAFKSGKQIEENILEKKSYYFLGQHKTNSVVMLHQSISRFQAVIINDQTLGQCIIDLGSKSGTFLNERKLEAHIPYRFVDEEIKLRFAVSTRIYKLSIDNSEVERNIEIKKRQLEKDLKILDKLNTADVNHEILLASLGLVVDDTLFVSNLPDNISQKTIESRFSVYGKIKDITLPIDKKTGKTQKFCFITYYEEYHAKKALIANRTYIDQTQIKVRLAEKKNIEDQLEEKLDRLDKEQLRKKYENKSKEIYDKKYGTKVQSQVQVNQQIQQENQQNEEEEEKQNHRKNRNDDKDHHHHKKDKRKHKKSRSRSRSNDKDKRKKDKKDKNRIKSKSRDRERRKSEKKNKHDKTSKSRSESRSKSKTKKDKKRKEKNNDNKDKDNKNSKNSKDEKQKKSNDEKTKKQSNKTNNKMEIENNEYNEQEQIVYSSASSNSDASSDLQI